MKKAVIDQIFLGFIIIMALIAFIATSLDETVARDKVYNLKSILYNATKAMGTYYNKQRLDETIVFDEDAVKAEAETIAYGIIEQSALGHEIRNSVVLTWDFTPGVCPDDYAGRAIATLNDYQHSNFFYRYFGLSFFDMDVVETFEFGVTTNCHDPSFAPMAVNTCTQDFIEETTYEYLLKSYDLYDPNDNVGFFGLYPEGGGQSSFAHLKNVVGDIVDGKETDDMKVSLYDDFSVATVDAAQIANDVKQIAQAFAINSFTNTPMTILEAGCNSTADNIEEVGFLTIDMEGVYCGDGCIGASVDCSLLDLTGNVFNATAWDIAVNSCNSEDFFKIKFTVKRVLTGD